MIKLRKGLLQPLVFSAIEIDGGAEGYLGRKPICSNPDKQQTAALADHTMLAMPAICPVFMNAE
jgi:hypothetical protein